VTRRTVRVDPQFFTELDAQLGEARGPNGEPSASDFLLIELPTIADAFAERFDELLRLYPERDDYLIERANRSTSPLDDMLLSAPLLSRLRVRDSSQ
jgi:hypothetical protein